MSEIAATPTAPEAPAPQTLQIRRLAFGDLPSVLSIERRSFSAPWSLAMFVLEVSKRSGICLAATEAEGLTGFLVCSRYADVWHLMNVAVAPHRRQQGVARLLLDRLFAEAGRDARYTLEVRASNQVAVEMYERLGFRHSGVRRGYYHDNGEDALIMWLGRPDVG